MKKFILAIMAVTACSVFSVFASDDNQQLLLLIEYVAVDYNDAVHDGAVINETEYEEMLEFSRQVSLMGRMLATSTAKPAFLIHSAQLEAAVKRMASAKAVKTIADKLIEILIRDYAVLNLPDHAPDLETGSRLYQSNCASCHGKDGFGDGPAAKALDPQPTNFNNPERYRQRTLSGLYNAISLGVDGTGMVSFAALSENDRWSLAFYVGSIAADSGNRPATFHINDVKALVTMTPDVAVETWGETGAAEISWLRRNPAQLFHEKSSPLDFSRQKLEAALLAYQSGNRDEAYQYSLVAYLEGFELVEPAMKAVDADLTRNIETAMSRLRSDIQSSVAIADIESAISDLNSMLDEANELLHTTQLSPVAAFSSALVILLREGIEAMLVVLALVTFLQRTDRKEGVNYIHFGWIAALLAGGITWWISNSIVSISGASREVTEGVAALVASAILLYVGFWMHSKANAVQWQQYIEKEALKALSSGALLGLSGLAFIAVYREVFETILFYQALWTQTSGAGRQAVVYGFGVGVISLLAVALLIARFSARLPIRQFFVFSAILMFGLAFILAGKGVAALQEAGWVSIHPVPFISIDALGIHPYLESLTLQLIVLVIGVIYWLVKVRNIKRLQ